MRVIFMGTPDFSVPVLDALVAAGHDVVAAYSQPPRRSGRGKKERPGPVHQRATELGIPVLTPTSLRTDVVQEEYSSHNADVAIVVAYGLILPQVILDAPECGCLNSHASL
jgi:methionyl-tRNA formyltransferase